MKKVLATASVLALLCGGCGSLTGVKTGTRTTTFQPDGAIPACKYHLSDRQISNILGRADDRQLNLFGEAK